MLAFTVLSVGLVAASASVINKGFYAFNSPNWNYDLSQTSDNCPSTCAYGSTPCGPACWAGDSAVKEGENYCGGMSQTPIDLSQSEVDHDLTYPSLNANGGCSKWTQFANDHAFEVKFIGNFDSSYDCDNMSLDYEGVNYKLHQFHFHAPSEHTIGGGEFDAELHMVHISDDGQILVLGVFLQAQADATIAGNTYLQPFWKISNDFGMNATVKYSNYLGVKGTNVDAYALLPANRVFYTYSGSLTTVPCTEGLTWLVFAEAVPIGASDLANLITSVKQYPNTITLKKFKWYNGRPAQPLNGRSVRQFDPASPVDADKTETLAIRNSNASLGISIVSLFLAAVILSIVMFMCLHKENEKENESDGGHEVVVAADKELSS